MKHLLIVHHSPSPNTRLLVDHVTTGANTPDVSGVTVAAVDALEADSAAVISADGYLLGTPANLGYMSGALKHFFDVVYNDAVPATTGRPFGYWVHGESDVEGARLAIEKITTGLGWKLTQKPVLLIGQPTAEHLDECWELGAAASAMLSV